MKITKRTAIFAAALFILSVLIYISLMIFSVRLDIKSTLYHNYFSSDRFKLILLMSVISIAASIYVLRAAISTRGFLRALIFQAIYLVFLVLSYQKFVQASISLFYGRDVIAVTPAPPQSVSLQIMTFIPCILSMILEALACILTRTHIKDNNTSNECHGGVMHVKIKRFASTAAAFCILSVLFYIGVMIFTVCSYSKYWWDSHYNYISDSFVLIIIMSVYSIIASIYVLLTAIRTRRFLRALIIEVFYLVALISSFDKIAYADGILFIRLYGGDIAMGFFLLIMTYIPCILSIVIEARAFILERKHNKL